jgi:adenine-specific DNA-methyltransferase
MNKLTKEDGASPDLTADTVEKMKGIVPEAFADGRIDFDVLRQVLGDHIDDRDERYSFTWHGKNRARQIAQTPSTGTLLPCPEESVDWDTTKNIFIEGDNLEVLKLLQKSYHRKVKMIYIDPPYNTGKEFIYPDKWQDNLDTYLRYTGQVDNEGLKLSANSETAGRYHTNWLNMMYPRIRLARNLLTDDGVIFMTIDDVEVANLRKLCDEVFGEENFVTSVAWQKKVSPANDATWFSSDHDHILVYARSKDRWRPNRLEMNERQRGYYKNPDNDPRGPWNSTTYTCNKTKSERPNLYYPIRNPNTGNEVLPKETAVWAYSKERHQEHVSDNRIYWGKDGVSTAPRMKKFLSDAKGVVPRTVWLYADVGHTQEATQELRMLLPDAKFETPKPTRLVEHMLKIGSDSESVVLDFFAGSCATAEAVLRSNARDGGNRRFVVVQLPEKIDEGEYSSVAEIGKARLRAAARVAQEEFAGENTGDNERLDLGFRVLKLASSNIKPWNAGFESIGKDLIDSVDNIEADRSEGDVLYELLLKYGLDLAISTESREIEGRTVTVIGAGALVVCLADDIALEVVTGIAALKDELNPEVMRVVFKDSGFPDDVAKTNATQILRQAGIDDVKSL